MEAFFTPCFTFEYLLTLINVRDLFPASNEPFEMLRRAYKTLSRTPKTFKSTDGVVFICLIFRCHMNLRPHFCNTDTVGRVETTHCYYQSLIHLSLGQPTLLIWASLSRWHWMNLELRWWKEAEKMGRGWATQRHRDGEARAYAITHTHTASSTKQGSGCRNGAAWRHGNATNHTQYSLHSI